MLFREEDEDLEVLPFVDHGKYLTAWSRVGKKWLIAADAWSSDLPPSR
jgi:hypothetical protein